MTDPVILLQILWTGIAMSSYFVLFTVAFALTLKVEKLWNFAQAGLMGIAFYAMFYLLNAAHWPAWLGVGAAVVLTAAVSVAVEVWAIAVLRRRHSSGLIFFIFTLIFSQLVAFVLTLMFGTEPETIFPSVMSPVRIVGGVAVSDWDLQAIGVTVALLAVLYWLIRHTRDGQFMLAVADNDKLAEIYGISAKRAYLLSGIVAAVLICAGVYLYGTRAGVTPDVPIGLVLTAVIATLVGGLGRIFSAAIAAVGLALMQSFSILFIPAKWQALLLYFVLFFALVLFPRGIPVWRIRRAKPLAPVPVAQAGGEPMEYLASAGMLIGIYMILAASYNLIIGYGGLNTIAHPIFFALGAYTAALLGINTALPSIVCVLAGIGVAVVASVALAVTTLRIEGDYLLIASLGFQLGLLQLVNNFEFTGGPSGLSNIPVTITGPARGWLYLLICAVLAIVVVWLIWRAMAGPFGRAVRAMRDDELACAALGRSLFTMKIVIFAFGCGAAGLAGGLYAYYFQYISPEQFNVAQSATILTMVVLGGIGTTWGPLIGAFVLVALPQAITFMQLPSSLVGPLQGIIFTVLVILFLFVRPHGLVGRREAGVAH